jgi:hypothetical protein
MGKECWVKMTKMEGRRQKAEDRSRTSERRRQKSEYRSQKSVVCPLSSVVCPPSSVSRRRGIALIWTAVVLGVLILFVGLALDAARLFLVATQLHNAADAASLAGALHVKTAYHEGNLSSAFTIADALANANYADGDPVDLYYYPLYSPDVDVVVGLYRPLAQEGIEKFVPFDPTNPISPNAVKVVARDVTGWPVNRPIALFFGPLAGVQTADVARYAIAMGTGGGGAGLVCLAPDGVGLKLEGNSKVAVYGTAGVTGEIYVNSTEQSYAVEPGSNAVPVVDPLILANPDLLVNENKWAIYCGQLNVCGKPDPDIVTYYGRPAIYPVVSPAAPMPDPLKTLPDLQPLPDPGSAVWIVDGKYVPATNAQGKEVDVTKTIDSTTINKFGQEQIDGSKLLTLLPGYYSGGFTMTSGGNNLRLMPGIYAVGGGKNGQSGLNINGGVFQAEGVMIYVTKSLEGQFGYVNLNGSDNNGARISISQYTENGPANYEVYDGAKIITYKGCDPDYKDYADAGMTIFQDRDSDQDVKIAGGTQSTFAGTLYFHNEPDCGVTVDLSGNSGNVGIQLVTDRVEVSGTNSMITINYDGRNFRPCNCAYLVK